MRGLWWCVLCLPFGVSAGAGVRRSGLLLAFVVCSVPFVRFLALLVVRWLEICLYSHFKGVFGVVWGCCVGLFVLRALRGLCGLCTRVELGG